MRKIIGTSRTLKLGDAGAGGRTRLLKVPTDVSNPPE